MLRKILITSTILASFAGAALAQQTPAPNPAPATDAVPVANAAGHLASNIIGEDVYNSSAADAERVGEVNDIVIDANGAIASLIVGVGGFLGVGERNVALDFKTAEWAQKDNDRWLVVPMSKEQLEGLAPFDPAPYAVVPVVAPAAPAPATPAPVDAQPAPAEQPAAAPAPAEQPAVAPADANNPNAPVEGANSFTEAQAAERIAAAGYTEVTGLTLDDKGIWNASAKKDGAAVSVQMDYQGNVVTK